MDLKNAVAVCLISLFSATLVVLIARRSIPRRLLALSPNWPASSRNCRPFADREAFRPRPRRLARAKPWKTA